MINLLENVWCIHVDKEIVLKYSSRKVNIKYINPTI